MSRIQLSLNFIERLQVHVKPCEAIRAPPLISVKPLVCHVSSYQLATCKIMHLCVNEASAPSHSYEHKLLDFMERLQVHVKPCEAIRAHPLISM